MFLPGLFQAFFSDFSTLKLTATSEIHQICTAVILQPIVRASTLNGVDCQQQSQRVNIRASFLSSLLPSCFDHFTSLTIKPGEV